MNPLASQPSGGTTPADEDLTLQAHPGHGVPSQDPDAAAQFLLEPQEQEREAASVLAGGGMVAGAATGAADQAVLSTAAGSDRPVWEPCSPSPTGLLATTDASMPNARTILLFGPSQ